MVDPLFADTRHAPLYDAFGGDRGDLTAYLRLVRETGARTVLDVGCGTGCFALLATATGAAVTGVDHAAASIDVARGKPESESVAWCVGTASEAPPGPFDLAVMTGNVAQVFADGTVIDSDSTLRFRSDAENRALLRRAGFDVAEVREAPDRPGAELVYLARPRA